MPTAPHPPRPSRSARPLRGFSLVELVVVIAVLGVLTLLILPSFSDTGEEARRQAALSEMRTIQTAFQRLHDDAQLTPADLRLIGRYGLWPLVQNTWPSAFAGPGTQPPDTGMTAFLARLAKWDDERQRGWRGPYSGFEAAAPVETDSARPGQFSAADLSKAGLGAAEPLTLPVFADPWSSPYRRGASNADLSYYRIIVPPESAGPARHLALVCTGRNGLLETSPTNYDTYSAQFSPQGDDLVLRLLPLEN